MCEISSLLRSANKTTFVYSSQTAFSQHSKQSRLRFSALPQILACRAHVCLETNMQFKRFIFSKHNDSWGFLFWRCCFKIHVMSASSEALLSKTSLCIDWVIWFAIAFIAHACDLKADMLSCLLCIDFYHGARAAAAINTCDCPSCFTTASRDVNL